MAEPNYVSAEEFAGFKKETSEGISTILSVLEELKPKTDVLKTPEVSVPGRVIGQIGGAIPTTPKPESPDVVALARKAEAELSNNILLPHYQKVFEKYFDPEDGFTARMSFPEIDEKGNENGGITFTIFVPMKFSNTDDGYRKMHKEDLRTRALLAHNIAKGIDEWCKAVANNLKYNRNLRTK